MAERLRAEQCTIPVDYHYILDGIINVITDYGLTDGGGGGSKATTVLGARGPVSILWYAMDYGKYTMVWYAVINGKCQHMM